jgi:hypothetical protein
VPAETGAEKVDWIVIHVADTGIGMTDEQLAKLFRPFTQADASTQSKYGGTGLGLALSRRFCQMMGGDITVESALGRGSTFTIRLPAQVGGRAARPTSTRSSGSLSDVDRGSSVLVIDDDPAARDLLTRMLTEAGMVVSSFRACCKSWRLC